MFGEFGPLVNYRNYAEVDLPHWFRMGFQNTGCPWYPMIIQIPLKQFSNKGPIEANLPLSLIALVYNHIISYLVVTHWCPSQGFIRGARQNGHEKRRFFGVFVGITRVFPFITFPQISVNLLFFIAPQIWRLRKSLGTSPPPAASIPSPMRVPVQWHST